MEPLRFEDGEYLITQGHFDDSFFIIEKGKVLLNQRRNSSHRNTVGEPLGNRIEHDVLGEEGFLRKAPACHSVKASGVVTVMKIITNRFEGRLRKELFDLFFYRFEIQRRNLLSGLSIFEHLNEDSLGEIVNRTTIRHYAPDQYLCHQGEDADCFFIVVAVCFLKHYSCQSILSIFF